MNKLKEMLDGTNFNYTVLMLIALIFSANGVDVDAETISEATEGQTGTLLIITIITSFLNPVIKIVRNTIANGFSFSFLKSTNFWVQFGTGLILFLSSRFGFIDIMYAIITGIVANIGNLGLHALDSLKYIDGEKEKGPVLPELPKLS